MRTIRSLALGAGFFFVTLALFVQGFLPSMIPESRTPRVTRAVRTDLGEVKRVRYEAIDYTPLEQPGRRIYIREGCWYCHSQYVRPVTREEFRWGPVSEAGEYTYDLPHLFSTRRIGPDLSRAGLKYTNDWHYAHHWDPRLTVPDSITTPSGSLPTDGDLFRTVTRRVRWTAMPTWHEVPEKDRMAVIQYVKTFSERWKAEKPGQAQVIPDPPQATAELLEKGAELFDKAKCWQCHGTEGRGDGPSADELTDDLGFAIRPTDFTKGQFKGGSHVPDIYRTMTLGLDTTPMPSFADSMTDEKRWAISYYVLSLSAWSEPLTGQKLRLSPETQAALNSPERRADHPRRAYDPEQTTTALAQPDGKRRLYYPGIAE